MLAHQPFTCASCPVMTASDLRPKVSILPVRFLLGVITWAALSSAIGSANISRVKFQPRLGSDQEESQCLRLYEGRERVGGTPPVDIKGMPSDAECLWLPHIASHQYPQPQGSHQACWNLSLSLPLMFQAHVTERGPLGGPCRLRGFICERKIKKAQLSVTEDIWAANKTESGSTVLHLIGHPVEVRIVSSAKAREMCR